MSPPDELLIPDTVVPPGVGLVAVVLFSFAAFIAARAGAWIASFLARKHAAEHWTVRARHATHLWFFQGAGPIFCALVASTVFGPVFSSEMDEVPLLWHVAAGLAAFLSAVLGSRRAEEVVKQRSVRARDAIGFWITAGLLYLPSIVVFALMSLSMPDRLNPEAFWLAAVACVLVVFLMMGGSAALLRLMRFIVAGSPSYNALIQRVSARMGVPCRQYILRSAAANAMALPYSRMLLFTDSVVAIMTEPELEAICAHELAHLSEPRAVRLARFAGAFVFLPLFAAGAVSGTYGSAGWIACVALTCFGYLLFQRLARRMELRADTAGRTQQADDGVYARALEKLYEFNLLPAVTRNKRAVHPDLYDRMVASGVTPAYARPQPPDRWLHWIAILVTLCVLVALSIFGGAMLRLLMRALDM